MKNLISYKKSGLNALRKAFSLIVVLCTFLQGAWSQAFEVEGWYNVVEEGDPSSRVVATDECGMVYRVYIETNSPGQDRIFAIKNPATGE